MILYVLILILTAICAGTWRITIVIEDTTNDSLKIQIKEVLSQRIQVEGIVKPTISSNNTATRYASTTDSDLSTMKKLVNTNGSSSTEYYGQTTSAAFKAPTEVLIKEFVTDATNLNGFYWNTSVASGFRVRGKFTKSGTAIVPDVRKVKIYIYHRDASTGDALIQTLISPNFDSTETYSTYVGNITNGAIQFNDNDRLHIKVYALFQHGAE